MDNNLERWSAILDWAHRLDLYQIYELDLEKERLYDSRMMDCCIADTEEAIIAVLEKWHLERVQPWAEETRGLDFCGIVRSLNDDWCWVIRGTIKRHEDLTEARILLAESLMNYI